MSESYNPMNAMTSEIADLRKELARLRRQLDTAREALRTISQCRDMHEDRYAREVLRGPSDIASRALAVLDGEDKADG